MAIEILKIYVFSQFFPSFFLLIVLFIFDFLAVFSQGIASRRFEKQQYFVVPTTTWNRGSVGTDRHSGL